MADALGRKTGGRKKGGLNKATKDVRVLAQKYTTEAIETLVGIMRTGKTDEVKKSASDSLLDRGYGKPAQAQIHQGDPNRPIEFLLSFKSGI